MTRGARLVAACLGTLLLACGNAKDAEQHGFEIPLAARNDGSEAHRSEGPTIIGNHAVIRSGAVGPLRIGAWRRRILSLVYVVHAHNGADSTELLTIRGIGRDTLVLGIAHDTLRTVTIDHAGATTRGGITVGTTLAMLRAAAGVRTAQSDAWLVPQLCGVEFHVGPTPGALPSDSSVRRIVVGRCSTR